MPWKECHVMDERLRFVPAQYGSLVAADDDLEVFRRARPEPQEQQLQHALNRNVHNGQNHGTSGNTTRSPLFYADRINAPYRSF